MAGPGLEVFRFAMYLMLPFGAMIHFSKPEWYTQNVLPVSTSTRLLSNPIGLTSLVSVQRQTFSRSREDQSRLFLSTLPHPHLVCILITLQDLPVDQLALKEELSKIMAAKKLRRLQREQEMAQEQK